MFQNARISTTGHGIFTPGGEDNQGGGEDTPGNFNPRVMKMC